MLGEHPHLTQTHWAERYGPLMHLWLGSINTMVASSPTMAKEFLKTQDHVFQYHPSSFAFKILKAWEWYLVLLCNTSEIYAWMSFSHLKKKIIPTYENKRDSRDNQEIIDISQYWYGAFIISDYIPYLKWVAKLQGIDTSLQALQNELSNFIAQIMDEHKTSPSTQNWNIGDVPKDFVDVLFATPQEDGFENLTWWCNSSFYHGECKIVVLKTMVIFIIVKTLMFKGICIKLHGF